MNLLQNLVKALSGERGQSVVTIIVVVLVILIFLIVAGVITVR